MRLRLFGAAALVCALALAGSAAEASPRQKQVRHDSDFARACEFTNGGRVICHGTANRMDGHARVTAGYVEKSRNGDPRPAAWCGWWLRQYLGVADRAFNRALAWVRYGTRAGGPHEGVIVVWSRGGGRGHVGIITGRSGGQWIVKSGNDGHAVRERPRSLAGAIAFRWPNGVAGL